MPSPYSSALADSVRAAPVRSLGQELAALCIDGNLPAVYVAQVLGVTRMTLHTWFRGGVIRERKHPKIVAFMRLVREDILNGVLPAKTFSEARSYLQGMSEEPIKTVTTLTRG